MHLCSQKLGSEASIQGEGLGLTADSGTGLAGKRSKNYLGSTHPGDSESALSARQWENTLEKKKKLI